MVKPEEWVVLYGILVKQEIIDKCCLAHGFHGNIKPVVALKNCMNICYDLHNMHKCGEPK